MKKLILVFAAIVVTAGAYAQTDSTHRRMSPPDMNNDNRNDRNDRNDGNMNDRNTRNTIDSQDQNRDTRDSRGQNAQQNDRPLSDGVVMQNGRIMSVKSGKMTAMDSDVTLSNGTKIMRDGSYTQKDGKKIMLKEGEHLDMSGKVSSTRTDKDKNMYLVPDNKDSRDNQDKK
jgi:uncharacterized protein YdeI (BOF family)